MRDVVELVLDDAGADVDDLASEGGQALSAGVFEQGLGRGQEVGEKAELAEGAGLGVGEAVGGGRYR